ncbi:solute carrier family 22 member 5-like [Stylophora pistillata]|uniref:solute carrier family 22 member 5-like n=1 Tax=Stylophora pistillata TaxID=50429 RepID=UPI000C03FF6A|nr:solute carrier family 22 member 5-like [Stylophora pistillata]
MDLTADQALTKIGSFGRYQLRLLTFASILGWFWFAWPALLSTFIAAEPGWHCVANSTECQTDAIVYLGDDNYDLRCNMSRRAWEFVGDYTSVITQFDLVCDKAIYGTVSSSLLFLGSLMGSTIISTLSDKFGRRVIIFTSGFVVALFSLLSAFPNSYWLFTLFRFIVGFFLSGGVSIFILISEFVGAQHRAMMGTSLWYSWTLSLICLAGIAYLITDWRLLCIVTGAPAIPLALGFLFMCVSRFVNALVYYGVYLSTPTIGGSMHLNFFLTSVIELPAIPAGIWIYNRFGRKRGVIVPMLLTAVGTAGSILLTTDDESNKGYFAGKIIMSLIWAKFWIMISYDGLYVYSGELFPTAVRNIAMGTSKAAAGIGVFFSPYIIYSERFHPILPYGIMGLNALAAGLLSMFLEETRYQPTLETVDKSKKKSSKVITYYL